MPASVNVFELLLRAAQNTSVCSYDRASATEASFLHDPTHGTNLSYTQALDLIVRVSSQLRRHVRKGRNPRLALVSPYNQPAQIICMFAAWLAGWQVAMVPVTMSTPAPLLEAMLKLAQPSLILASQAAQSFPRVKTAVAASSNDNEEPMVSTFGDFLRQNLPPATSASSVGRDPLLGELAYTCQDADLESLDLTRLGDVDDPALILFTSSAISKETVKAVELSHRFLYLQAEGSLGVVRPRGTAHVLGCSSLNHAMGIYIELVAFVLGTGGSYSFPCHPDVLVERRGLLGEESAHALRSSSIQLTATTATPGLVKAWLAEPELESRLRDLEILPVAGADIDISLFRQAKRDSVPIAACYGMTEIGVAAYGRPATEIAEDEGFRVMQLTGVLSTPGLPPKGDFASSGLGGHIGQLIINADADIFRGYYMLDHRGCIQFRPHIGMYETGDLMQFSSAQDSDPRCPAFSFVSRLDDTIQLESGDKILAGLFEQALDSCDGILRSFVCGDQESSGNRQSRHLVAYIELEDALKSNTTPDETKRCISKAIAKVNATVSAPARISADRVCVVDSLPVTSKNATFRKKIKAELRQYEQRLDQASRGPTEAVIRQVISEARMLIQDQLGVGPEEIKDGLDLASLGLDSSRAVAFFGRIKTKYDVQLDPALLFTTETYGQLCANISETIKASRQVQQAPASTPAKTEDEMNTDAVSSEPITRDDKRIAVVGAGLRLPGNVNTVADFWQSLHDNAGPGGEKIFTRLSEKRRSYLGLEGERMPQYPCGWIGEAGMEDFDAAFFGLSDDEALHTKPQQRLLLEVAYETLQDALIPPQSLRGKRVGVFIGCSNADGYDEVIRHAGVDQYNKHAGGSLNQSVLCGRLSHHFDWTGPSITIQTACSSSLNGIDLATSALRNGDCDYALVGGVTTHIGAITLSFLESAGMSSSTGTSTPFGTGSDGYVPSEGCALLMLRRVEDAQTSSDRIYGCIDAAVSAHQGRTATMATTNSKAQRKMYEAVMKKAGVSPEQVALFEAHGTSTPLGDSIEASAIIQTFKGRSASLPLVVSSAKSVFGHCEEAAGILGTLKALLCLQNGVAPPHHAGAIRQAARWNQVPARMASDHVNPLAVAPSIVARALVSGIGFAGTLGALVVSPAPSRQQQDSPPQHGHLLQFSAPSLDLLRCQMTGAARLLSANKCDLGTLEVTLAHGQDIHSYGQGIVARSRDDALEAIRACIAQTASDRRPTAEQAARPSLQRTARPYAVQFSGQGKLEHNSGLGWYRTSPIYRSAFDRCADMIMSKIAVDIRRVLFADADSAKSLLRPSIAQPCLFALHFAHYTWLRAHMDTAPSVVFGHSIGELSAAAAAGKLSLEDAVALVCLRGSLCEQAPPGSMLAVKCSHAQVETILGSLSLGNSIGVAARNGPDALTLSGTPSAIADFERSAAAQGIKTTRLTVSIAYHHRDSLQEIAKPLLRWKPTGAATPSQSPAFLSTAQASDDGDLSGDHWFRHLIEPVMYADTLQTALKKHRPTAIIEVGPSPQLSALAMRQLPGVQCLALAARREAEVDQPALLALQALFHAGYRVTRPELEHLRAEHGGASRSLLCLFDRKRFWPDVPVTTESKHAVSTSAASASLQGLGIDIAPVSAPVHVPASPSLVLSLHWTLVGETDHGSVVQAKLSRDLAAELAASGPDLLSRALYEAILVAGISQEHKIGEATVQVRKIIDGLDAIAFHCLALCPKASSTSQSARLSLVATDSMLRQTTVVQLEASLVESAPSIDEKLAAPRYSRTRFVPVPRSSRCLKYLVECSPDEWEGLVQEDGGVLLAHQLGDIIDAALEPSPPLSDSVVNSVLKGVSDVGLDSAHRVYIRKHTDRISVALAPWDAASRCVFSADIPTGDSSVTPEATDGPSIKIVAPSMPIEESTEPVNAANPLYLPPHKSRLHPGILRALDDVAAVHCRNSLRDCDEASVQPAQQSYFRWARDVAANYSGQQVPYEPTQEERDEFESFFEAIHRVGRRQKSIYRDSKAAVQALFCPDILTEVYRKTAAAENIGKSIPQVLRHIARAAKDAGHDRCKILEIGAGTGQLTRLVAAASEDVERELGVTVELVLTDVAISMARKARQAAIDAGFDESRITISTINIVTGELGAAVTAAGSGAFDAVMMADVLHIATDLDQILATFRRLLRANGCLYAWELDASLLESQGPGAIFIEHLFGAFPDWWPQTRKHAVLSEKAWIELLSASFATVHTHHPALEGAGSILLFAQKPIEDGQSKAVPLADQIKTASPSMTLDDIVTPASCSFTSFSNDGRNAGRYHHSSAPTTVESVSAPRLDDGKLDANATQAFAAPVPTLDAVIAATTTAVTQVLDSKDTLRLEQDLFEIGLDSLVSAQVLARLSRELSVELPLDLFYTSSTIGAAAREIHSIVMASTPAPEPCPPAPAAAVTETDASLPAITEAIREACQHALQLDEEPSAGQDLFDSGLDSLTSAQIIAKIEKAFHVELPVDLFYNASTISAAASQVLDLIATSSVQDEETTSEAVQERTPASSSDVAKRPPADDDQLELESECRNVLSGLQERAEKLVFQPRTDKSTSTGVSKTILLTGVTGTVGSNLAVALVRRGHRLICLSRKGKSASAMDRLSEIAGDILAPQDAVALRAALRSGQIEVLETDDMNSPGLGLSDSSDRDKLLSRVDSIVHSAWRIAYSPRLSGYSRHFSGLLELLKLAAESGRIVEFHFVSSVAAARAAAWPATTLATGELPERIASLDPGLRLTDNEAYSTSKLVAELLLSQTIATLPQVPGLAVHRLSQVSGNSKTGWWKPNSEVAPCILSSVAALQGAFLAPQATADWIPSDVCGAAMADLIEAPIEESVEVYHLANPNKVDVATWCRAWTRICSDGKITQPRFLRPAAYKAAIEEANGDATTASRGEAENPALRLLAYMKALERLDDRATQLGVTLPREALQTTRTERKSSALRACPAVDESLMRLYLRSFRRQWSV